MGFFIRSEKKFEFNERIEHINSSTIPITQSGTKKMRTNKQEEADFKGFWFGSQISATENLLDECWLLMLMGNDGRLMIG